MKVWICPIGQYFTEMVWPDGWRIPIVGDMIYFNLYSQYVSMTISGVILEPLYGTVRLIGVITENGKT